MDWLLENFGKFLPVILAVLYFWLNSRKRGPEAEEADGPDSSEVPERARRIQEEIRRRILERQQGGMTGPLVEPPVVVEESLHQHQDHQIRSVGGENIREAVPDLREEYQPPTGEQELLERQARLVERFEEARRRAEARKALKKRARNRPVSEGSTGWSEVLVDNPLRRALLSDLKDRTGLKRAILLREVLGEPVGLRKGPLPQK